MKTYKKIGTGLALLVTLAIGVTSLFGGAAGAADRPQQFNNYTGIFDNVVYTFKGGQIHATLQDTASAGLGASTKPQPIALTFSQIGNTNEYQSDKNLFCKGPVGQDAFTGVPAKIKLNGSTKNDPVKATLEKLYTLPVNGSACSTINDKSISINNKDVTPNKFPDTVTYQGDTYFLIDPAFNIYGKSKDLGTSCYGGTVIIPDASGNGQVKIFTNLTVTNQLSGLGDPLSKKLIDQKVIDPTTAAGKSFSNLISDCYSKDPTGGSDTKSTVKDGVVASASTGGQQNPSESDACLNKGFFLDWLACPLLETIDKTTSGINDLIQAELTTHADEVLNSHTRESWSIFSRIATAILVIIMLIMVFSQAIGGGPFDAYTIRKLLPKIIFAVIIMQLSWTIFGWAIQLSNDAGYGIKDILALPFGGTGQLDLESLIGHLGGGAASGTIFTGVLGAGFIAIFNPFLFLLIAFMIIMAAITGLAVLLARHALIIASVMFFPLAIVAWILPGTNRYWKLWWDNFTRLLLLFPLIIGMIYIGRIFAWIISSGGGSGGTALFFDWAAILIGYFGPYFLLPRTFKWGGSLLSTAAGGISQALKPVNDFGNKEVREMGQRYQGKWAKDYDPEGPLWAAEKRKRKIFGKEFTYRSPVGGKMIKRVQSGHFLPTKRSQRQTTQKGDKWQSEVDEMSMSTLKRGGEKALQNGYQRVLRDEDGNILKLRKNAEGKMIDKDGVETDKKEEAALLSDDADQIAAQKALNENDTETLQRLHQEGKIQVDELYGIDAMKSYWVDKSEDKDSAIAKMAKRALIDTSSWPELEGRFTKSGVRVVDLPDWGRHIGTSNEHYKATLAGRTSAAPHIANIAEKEFPDPPREKISDMLASGDINKVREARRIIHLRQARKSLYAIEDQLTNDEIGRVSDGEVTAWRRAVYKKNPDGSFNLRGNWNRNEQTGEMEPDKNDPEAVLADKVRRAMHKRLEAIYATGPTTRQTMIGPLMNGGSKQENMEQLLGGSLQYYTHNRDDPKEAGLEMTEAARIAKRDEDGGGGGGGGGPTLRTRIPGSPVSAGEDVYRSGGGVPGAGGGAIFSRSAAPTSAAVQGEVSLSGQPATVQLDASGANVQLSAGGVQLNPGGSQVAVGGRIETEGLDAEQVQAWERNNQEKTLQGELAAESPYRGGSRARSSAGGSITPEVHVDAAAMPPNYNQLSAPRQYLHRETNRIIRALGSRMDESGQRHFFTDTGEEIPGRQLRPASADEIARRTENNSNASGGGPSLRTGRAGGPVGMPEAVPGGIGGNSRPPRQPELVPVTPAQPVQPALKAMPIPVDVSLRSGTPTVSGQNNVANEPAEVEVSLHQDSQPAAPRGYQPLPAYWERRDNGLVVPVTPEPKPAPRAESDEPKVTAPPSTSTEAVPVRPITPLGPTRRTQFDKVEVSYENALEQLEAASKNGDTAGMNKLNQQLKRIRGQLNHLYSTRSEGWDANPERKRRADIYAGPNASTELAIPDVTVNVSTQAGTVVAPSQVDAVQSTRPSTQSPQSNINPDLQERLKEYKTIKREYSKSIHEATQTANEAAEAGDSSTEKLFKQTVVPSLHKEAQREVKKVLNSGDTLRGASTSGFGAFDQRAKDVQEAAKQGTSPGPWQPANGGSSSSGAGKPPPPNQPPSSNKQPDVPFFDPDELEPGQKEKKRVETPLMATFDPLAVNNLAASIGESVKIATKEGLDPISQSIKELGSSLKPGEVILPEKDKASQEHSEKAEASAAPKIDTDRLRYEKAQVDQLRHLNEKMSRSNRLTNVEKQDPTLPKNQPPE
jgi:hypothetical protein